MRVVWGGRRLGLSAVAAAVMVTLSVSVANADPGPRAAAGSPVTSGTAYDRNSSVVQDGRTTWLFFARSQAPCNRLAGCDADNSNYDLYAARSGDQGRSWNAPELVAANPSQPNQPPFRGRTPSATVDRSGKTWVFWASGGNGGPLYYTHNDGPGSGHWAALESIDDATHFFNASAVTRGATTYVYYEDGAGGGIHLRTFDGSTFSEPTLVTAGMSLPKVMVDRYGIFRMAMVDSRAWPTVDVLTSWSLDGVHWWPPQVVVKGDGTVTNWDPALVQTADGVYHLFWAPDRGDGNQRIETKTSRTFLWWSQPTVVTSPTGYWDYWPTPTALRGLSLFYTSEAGTPAGTGHIYQLTVPTSTDQCRGGGWREFTHPVFENQNACVTSVPSHDPHG